MSHEVPLGKGSETDYLEQVNKAAPVVPPVPEPSPDLDPVVEPVDEDV